MKEQIKEGQLELGFQDLTHEFVKFLLAKMEYAPPSGPPHKCRRIDGKRFDSEVIRDISSCSHVWKINLAGNRKLGDEVTTYLPMLPKTISDIDLSGYGLSATGVRNVCKFMESNETITKLIMCGNIVDEDGARHIRDMLKQNTTLQEFCCCTAPSLTTNMKLLVADGLEHNQTLQKLSLDYCAGDFVDAAVYHKFRSVLERAGNNSAVKTLEIGAINRDANIDLWEGTVQKCENLCHFGPNSSSFAYNRSLMYYRALNMCNARKITRGGEFDEFKSAVKKAVQNRNINVTYFLLRNNVDCISRVS
mmetsp:Transcript_8519/g.18043  ORF Transcript_8519/g.18043 Transcript_8519/m.18043 type:complete len:306 (-) Transcript_8519:185-1102(-)